MARDRREMDGQDGAKEHPDQTGREQLEAQPKPAQLVVSSLLQAGQHDEEGQDRRGPEGVAHQGDRTAGPQAVTGVAHGAGGLDALGLDVPVNAGAHAEAADHGDDQHGQPPQRRELPTGPAGEGQRVEPPLLTQLDQARRDRVRPSRRDHADRRDQHDGEDGDDALQEVAHHHAPVARGERVQRGDHAGDDQPDPDRPAEDQLADLAHGDADPAQDEHVHEDLPSGEPATQQLGAQSAEAQHLPLGLGVGQRAAEDAGGDEGGDGGPGAEERVPQPAQAVGVDHAGDPHRRVGGGVGAEHRGSRQPPGQAAAGEEEVGLGAARQPVEEERAADHQQQEGGCPEPVKRAEFDHENVNSTRWRRFGDVFLSPVPGTLDEPTAVESRLLRPGAPAPPGLLTQGPGLGKCPQISNAAAALLPRRRPGRAVG